MELADRALLTLPAPRETGVRAMNVAARLGITDTYRVRTILEGLAHNGFADQAGGWWNRTQKGESRALKLLARLNEGTGFEMPGWRRRRDPDIPTPGRAL